MFTQFPAAAQRVRAVLPRRADVVAMARTPRSDLLAGLTVAVVALPLALAFGVASGLGAEAGLATAIVAGVVAALFGGSPVQVSGPTGAMTVVLVPVVHDVGPTGVLLVGFLAGLLLVAMALARVGGFVRYLPISLIEGFTAGIAVVIACQQVPVALGITGVEGERVWLVAIRAVRRYAESPELASPALALGVAALTLAAGRRRPRWPTALVAVAAATVAARVFDLDVAVIGKLPAGLPAPSLSFLDPGEFGTVFGAALAVAALAGLESLLCATVADGMTVEGRHDPDRELFGQGLANLAVPVFGGIPATAAIARTAVNVRAGASSRLAAVTHALILLAVVAVAHPLVADIPLPALAGVLFATTIRMVEFGTVRALVRATPSDAGVMLLTFAVTVLLDLVVAVGVGVALAVVLALRDVARNASLEEDPVPPADHGDEEHALWAQRIVAYRLDGPLVFAAAHQLLVNLPDIADVEVVIIRMSHVSSLDATGASLLGDAVTRLERRGVVVMLSGIRSRHDPVLSVLGVAAHLRAEGRIFPDTPSAIAAARALLRERGAADPGA